MVSWRGQKQSKYGNDPVLLINQSIQRLSEIDFHRNHACVLCIFYFILNGALTDISVYVLNILDFPLSWWHNIVISIT